MSSNYHGQDVKISIVTISYNQAQFLERAIQSIIGQNYEDIEYIVVDPGSTDVSRDIIQRYASVISKAILEPDNGPVDGLNKGFRYATGDIFCYINADDALLPGALNKVATYFAAHPDVDVICGHGYVVNEHDKVLKKVFSDAFSVRRYIYGGTVILQQSTFFRQAAFRRVGGFNPVNETCWDGELMLDFGLHNLTIKVIDEFLSVFRIHQSSITGSGRLNEKYHKDLDRLFFKTKHRNKRWYDSLLRACARIEKIVRNPEATMHRALGCIKMTGDIKI